MPEQSFNAQTNQKDPGFFSKLLSNPAAMNMLLNGIGLFGAKTRNQADRYTGNISTGLLQQAKSKEDAAAIDSQRKYDAPFRQSQIDLNNARIGDLSAAPVVAPTGSQKDYQFAQTQGFQGSFLEYQTALAEAKRTSITNNVGGQDLKLQPGWMWLDPSNPAAGQIPIPGSKVLQTSGDAAKIKEIGVGGSDAIQGLKNMPIEQVTMLASELLPNFMVSDNVQKFNLLTTNLTDMVGRLRSGGAITADEEPRFRALIPKFGDSPETRRLKLEKLEGMFGRIAEDTSIAPITAGQEVAPSTTTGNETLEELLEIYQ